MNPSRVEDQLHATILRAFAGSGAGALFVTELQHATAASLDGPALATGLARLTEGGTLVMVTKTAPDPHLADADLRIVAPAGEGAIDAIEQTWRAWLREFLASHRCT